MLLFRSLTFGLADESDPGLAVTALCRAVEYIGRLHDLSDTMTAEKAAECKRLETDYVVQRTATVSWPPMLCAKRISNDMSQAWKQDHFEVAELMYAKMEQESRGSSDARTAETVADLLFNVGKDLSLRKDTAMAVKWLGRAHETIYCADVEELSREGIELRVAVTEALVTALLALDMAEASIRARDLVDGMMDKFGERPVVQLLQLDLLHKAPAEFFDADGYANTLRHMIRRFQHSDAYFKLLVRNIRRLHDRHPSLGCRILDDLLLFLRTSTRLEWVERLVATRLSMAAGHNEDAIGSIQELENVLSKVDRQMSPDAILACQTVKDFRDPDFFWLVLMDT